MEIALATSSTDLSSALVEIVCVPNASRASRQSKFHCGNESSRVELILATSAKKSLCTRARMYKFNLIINNLIHCLHKHCFTGGEDVEH